MRGSSPGNQIVGRSLLLVSFALAGCVNTTSGDDAQGGGGKGDGGTGNGGGGGGGGDGKSPTVTSVTISPNTPYVDGPVECSAKYSDADSEPLTATYSWKNATSGKKLGTGAKITLDPSDIDPGDTLRCDVTVEDSDGNSATDHDTVTPGCGFYDESSLADVNVSIHFIFRPYKTDDLVPGYEGEPWDWDGDVPDWIIDVVDVLALLADGASWISPNPYTLGAAEALDYAQAILDALEEYGPGLFAPTVPPDPNLYPYLVDGSGNVVTYSDVGEGFDWDDSYEADLTFNHQDFREYAGMAVDFEDYDVAFDDNMGDYLDQDSIPLVLSSAFFLDTAYCTSTYFNPSSRSLESDVSLVPSSVLWMQIEVW